MTIQGGKTTIMSVKVENKEHNMATLTIEVSAEELEKALERAYQKQKKSISIPGFRKGKVPRMIVEKMYGPAVFYEDAADELISAEYPKAFDECGLDIVSSPRINIVQIEKGKPFIFSADVAVKPEVELGEYKGVEVAMQNRKVTAKEVEQRLENEQKRQVRKTDVFDRAVKDGDEIDLDFDGYVDGEQFKGGKAEGYSLTIGSHTFIPGFEEQLIGVKPGEEKDVVAVFPDEYQEKSLAGKEATFKCKVNKIIEREYPEINDEFAAEVSEFETLAEYKKSLKKQMQQFKEEQARNVITNEAVRAASENAKMDIPQLMIDSTVEQIAREFEQQIRSQGMDVEQYLKMLGMTGDQMIAQFEPEAINRIRTRLTLEAVADAENIEITDEEFMDEMQKIADMYKMKAEDLTKGMTDEQKNQQKRDMAVQRAAQLIGDLAVEVEEKKEETAEKKPAAKKTTAKKSTAKKTTKKAEEEEKAEKKPAAKKTAAKKTAKKAEEKAEEKADAKEE